MKISVSAVSGQELFVGALLDDTPAVDDDNVLCEAHRAETVGDDKRGASGRRALKRVDNRALGGSIQTAGGLVENQNRCRAPRRGRWRCAASAHLIKWSLLRPRGSRSLPETGE